MTAGPQTTPGSLPFEALRPVLLRRARVLCARSLETAGWSPEDLVQETLTRLCAPNVLDRLTNTDIETVRPYAMRMIAHLFIDEVVRKKNPQPVEDIAQVSDRRTDPRGIDSAEGEMIERETHAREVDATLSAAADLTEQEREFLARTFETGSASAAQRELGWPPGKSSNASMKRARLIRRIQCALRKAQDQQDA